jgi:hypothetical protein
MHARSSSREVGRRRAGSGGVAHLLLVLFAQLVSLAPHRFVLRRRRRELSGDRKGARHELRRRSAESAGVRRSRRACALSCSSKSLLSSLIRSSSAASTSFFCPGGTALSAATAPSREPTSQMPALAAAEACRPRKPTQPPHVSRRVLGAAALLAWGSSGGAGAPLRRASRACCAPRRSRSARTRGPRAAGCSPRRRLGTRQVWPARGPMPRARRASALAPRPTQHTAEWGGAGGGPAAGPGAELRPEGLASSATRREGPAARSDLRPLGLSSGRNLLEPAGSLDAPKVAAILGSRLEPPAWFARCANAVAARAARRILRGRETSSSASGSFTLACLGWSSSAVCTLVRRGLGPPRSSAAVGSPSAGGGGGGSVGICCNERPTSCMSRPAPPGA